jgi:predicted transcriptional regulator
MIKTAKNSLVLLFFAGLFFQSCNRNDIYAIEIKSLDSLNGAINALAKEVDKTDTVILGKAILRFEQYKQFIQQNIKDTVTKIEADFIQQFYTSGTRLESFDANRRSLKARTSLVNSQLEKLKNDAKNKLLPEEKIVEFTDHEKKEANNLIEVSHKQQQLFYTSLQEFKTALRGVEDLIKARNSGQLPTVVKDTLSL